MFNSSNNIDLMHSSWKESNYFSCGNLFTFHNVLRSALLCLSIKGAGSIKFITDTILKDIWTLQHGLCRHANEHVIFLMIKCRVQVLAVGLSRISCLKKK